MNTVRGLACLCADTLVLAEFYSCQGIQVSEDRSAVSCIMALKKAVYRLVDYSNKTDRKFCYSEISEFALGNMLKKEALKAKKAGFLFFFFFTTQQHVIPHFTEKELEFKGFFPLWSLPACLSVCESAEVCVSSSLCTHVCVPYRWCSDRLFSYFISELGKEPRNSGKAMERFDFSIGSCEVICVCVSHRSPPSRNRSPSHPTRLPSGHRAPPRFLSEPEKLSCILLFFSPCNSALSPRPSKPGWNCCNECISDKKKSRV